MFGSALFMSCALRAEPSVPWTPSPAARHALELLVDEGGLALPVTQWPLPRAAVTHALEALPAELPPALDAARARVAAELRRAGGASLSLTLRGHADALVGFGDDATPGSTVGVRSGTVSGPRFAAQFGARVDADTRPDGHSGQFRLDGTAIATEAFGVQLQAWSHRSWWSPGWQSSLLLGQNAPPFNGIGLQRPGAAASSSRWLAWMGPWSYDIFVAQSDDAIHSYFVGTRLTLKPFRLLEIGLSRTAQWGGRGHAQTVRSFLRMLTNVGTNADTPQQRLDDPANEMAGIDLRLRCGFALPCALYAQLIGEDEAGGHPSSLLGLYGAETWSADGRHRWFAELAETICGAPFEHNTNKPCAYRNYAYPEGYVHDGRWIGSAAGADSRVWTLGWLDAEGGTSVRVHGGRIGARVGRFAEDDDPAHSGRIIGLGLRQSWDWGPATLGAELDWLRIAAPAGTHIDGRVGVSLRTPLDEPWRAAREGLGRSLSTRDGNVWRPLLSGVAVIAGAALLDRPLDNYVATHAGNASGRAASHAGAALPLVGFGLAGASWLAQRGSTGGDVAWSALAAGVASVAVAEAVKLGVDRARPTAGLGPASFGQAHPRSDSSFPSIHSTLAWALVTPYAEHYGMPWLYGAAALTSAARVAGRAHWFSDTVAGAVLGYAIGDRVLRANVDDDATRAQWRVGPGSVTWSTTFTGL